MNPETIAKLRRMGRWVHPLRWRFWFLTFPLLAFLMLVVLFTWPGLTGFWALGERFLVMRGTKDQCLSWLGWDAREEGGSGPESDDYAEFRAGPLTISKWTADRGVELPSFGEPGFNFLHDSREWMVGWQSRSCQFGLEFSLE